MFEIIHVILNSDLHAETIKSLELFSLCDCIRSLRSQAKFSGEHFISFPFFMNFALVFMGSNHGNHKCQSSENVYVL